MELVVKKIFSKHSKLGNEAERFRRFEPENIFKIKKKGMLFTIGYQAIREPLTLLEGPAESS